MGQQFDSLFPHFRIVFVFEYFNTIANRADGTDKVVAKFGTKQRKKHEIWHFIKG
jgi:hypothetical protein